MYSRELWLYASCKGVRATYYTSFDTERIPFIDRIEPYLPTIFDTSFRQLAFFKANFEFMWKMEDEAGVAGT